MQKISDSTNTASADGGFTQGNPAAGVDATRITAEWLNAVQWELVNLIQASGSALDPASNWQLLHAIQALAGAAADFLKLTNRPTTLDGYGITDGMKKNAGGLISEPPVVKGKLEKVTTTQFFSMADETTDRPPFFTYGSGVHIAWPGGGTVGVDFIGGIAGDPWFGARRYNADGTGVWYKFLTNADFNPADKANLAGATFTGAVRVPAVSDGDSSTQAANTAFVSRALLGLLGTAPAAMNTLGKVAAAIGNNPDYAASVNAALGAKANLSNTLAGYGITDGYTKSQVDQYLNNKANKATTIGGYGIADAYTKNEIDQTTNYLLQLKADKSTTLAGYGISNAYTASQIDSSLALVNTAIAQRLSLNGGTVGGQTTFNVGGQTALSAGLILQNPTAGNSTVNMTMATPGGAVVLTTVGGSNTLYLRNHTTNYAALDAGDISSNGQACHTVKSFMKPAEGQWVALAGTTTVPAGGTWAYHIMSYNAAGAALGGNAGLVAGGTVLGGTNSHGFAWRIF